MENSNKLLEYFGVKSHKDLTEYIFKNPLDEKSMEMKEILKEMGIELKLKKVSENE